jgi:hypothetical protein
MGITSGLPGQKDFSRSRPEGIQCKYSRAVTTAENITLRKLELLTEIIIHRFFTYLELVETVLPFV